jgi:hypothetical protein
MKLAALRVLRERGRPAPRDLLLSFVAVSLLLVGLLLAHAIAVHHGQTDPLPASEHRGVIASVDPQADEFPLEAGSGAVPGCSSPCEEPAGTAAALCLLALMVTVMLLRRRRPSPGGMLRPARNSGPSVALWEARRPVVLSPGVMAVCRT